MPKFPDVSAVAPHAGAWIEIMVCGMNVMGM